MSSRGMSKQHITVRTVSRKILSKVKKTAFFSSAGRLEAARPARKSARTLLIVSHELLDDNAQ